MNMDMSPRATGSQISLHFLSFVPLKIFVGNKAIVDLVNFDGYQGTIVLCVPGLLRRVSLEVTGFQSSTPVPDSTIALYACPNNTFTQGSRTFQPFVNDLFIQEHPLVLRYEFLDNSTMTIRYQALDYIIIVC